MSRPSAAEERLFRAISRRHTDRRTPAERSVPEPVVAELARTVAAEGARLHVVGNPASRLEISDLVARGERRLMADPAFRDELASWVRRESEGDGIPGHALGFPDIATPLVATLMRRFDLGRGQAERDREIALHAPLLVVLATAGDGTADWLAAGRALDRMLLAATGHGLSAAFLNYPVQVPELREGVRQVLATDDHPQLLLRLGLATPVDRPTPRRSLDAVIEGPGVRP